MYCLHATCTVPKQATMTFLCRSPRGSCYSYTRGDGKGGAGRGDGACQAAVAHGEAAPCHCRAEGRNEKVCGRATLSKKGVRTSLLDMCDVYVCIRLPWHIEKRHVNTKLMRAMCRERHSAPNSVVRSYGQVKLVCDRVAHIIYDPSHKFPQSCAAKHAGDRWTGQR